MTILSLNRESSVRGLTPSPCRHMLLGVRRECRFALVLVVGIAGCRRSDLTDVDGRPVSPFAGATSTTVFLFVATGCPISNRYVPELGRIQARFASRGVDFFLVYPSPHENADTIREHVREHALPMRALRDPEHVLVRRANATTTPEATVFHRGEVVYRGRIDDRQVDFGVTRPEPRRRDLELALEAVLAGKPVDVPVTQPIGCSIP
jgi:hypothetical protein